jgi:CubicO group peptidase (beta-lactamase class C family)
MTTLSAETLRAFAADVETALQTFRVPGAAVALVHDGEIVFNRGFGVRDLQSGAAVTPKTRFRIGSITKSMTALMLATLIDEGVFGWDDRAVDLWTRFRAPTDELTETLRLRDLLGMGSGLAEATDISVAAVEFAMSAGDVSPQAVLRSVADLPDIAPPRTTFSYNNTLVAAAAFLGLLARGADPGTLGEVYAAAVRERVFTPVGMEDAAILDDPRPLGDDYAVGYSRDIFGAATPLPFISIDGVAPAGAGLASATDMARYLMTYVNGGVAPGGQRVVSAANVAEMHRPGIVIEPGALVPTEQAPDTVTLHYDLGWLDETFRDSRRLLWHGGGIDGFSAVMGFFPAEKLGFAVLTNDGEGGSLCHRSVQASLLDRLFGLNHDLPALLADAFAKAEAQRDELAAQTQRVDASVVSRYLGLYQGGFRLRLDDAGALWLEHDIRTMPLLALPDETYVVAAGPDVVLGQRVSFAVDADTIPVMTIAGFRPARWLTGG